MGAALVIPILIITLAAVAYILWLVYASARPTASSAQDKPANETAPHREGNHISTTPPTQDHPR
ncbi:hypothetical protein HPO96_34325 [Kribbella sandramycini]|uniref:Threonine/homoserine/homoserine lactone efflux protein n=1 Tax=Kribbella sandramycini TaxID=60450 RepID=A0A7Y4L6L8_9ACTN|nr:hypothetical protein [Kribbella sandramycini]MBB6570478.1 threonine/homoserine/homoserine lactone efflux protein [Kribbella sandramycini]NOL45338.1 hypothetical protein [Kribbella sandramycini]